MSGRVHHKDRTIHSSRDFSIAVFGLQKQMETHILITRIYLYVK